MNKYQKKRGGDSLKTPLIILSERGEEFFNEFYKDGNIGVMREWLPEINKRAKRGLSLWESVVSVCGSSHLDLFIRKEVKK